MIGFSTDSFTVVTVEVVIRRGIYIMYVENGYSLLSTRLMRRHMSLLKSAPFTTVFSTFIVILICLSLKKYSTFCQSVIVNKLP